MMIRISSRLRSFHATSISLNKRILYRPDGLSSKESKDKRMVPVFNAETGKHINVKQEDIEYVDEVKIPKLADLSLLYSRKEGEEDGEESKEGDGDETEEDEDEWVDEKSDMDEDFNSDDYYSDETSEKFDKLNPDKHASEVKVEKKFCSRPLDMPPDTAEIQYDEEDFFFWNMINADNQDNVLKTKMKGLLVMDKTFNQKMYEAELFRALNPLSGTRDSDFEETDPTFELPASYIKKNSPFYGQLLTPREEESGGAIPIDDYDLDAELEDNFLRLPDKVPYVTGAMEDMMDMNLPQIYDINEVGIDGRPLRSVTKDMAVNDLPVKQEFLYGMEKGFMDQFPPLVQRTLSITNAGKLQLRKHRIAECIKRFQRFEGDTGSPACTVAAMTERLNSMQEHMSKNKKDTSSKRKMDLLIIKRRRYMTWMRKKYFNDYREVVNFMSLRDIGFPEVGQSRAYNYRQKNKHYNPLKGKDPSYKSHHPTEAEKGSKKKRKAKTKKMWRRNKSG